MTEHWIFLLLDDNLGIVSVWAAEEHPCVGRGDDPEVRPHPFVYYYKAENPKRKVVLVDKESGTRAWGEWKSEPSSRALLHFLRENFEVDWESHPEFSPRSMDGEKNLIEPHASYCLKELRVK